MEGVMYLAEFDTNIDVISMTEDTVLDSGEALPVPEATDFTPPSRLTVPVVESQRCNLHIAAVWWGRISGFNGGSVVSSP
ncbi:hypothetical protein Trydic_g20148 [Trypoxylus dichotomus]